MWIELRNGNLINLMNNREIKLIESVNEFDVVFISNRGNLEIIFSGNRSDCEKVLSGLAERVNALNMTDLLYDKPPIWLTNEVKEFLYNKEIE